jgi:hypothetical protein
VLVKYTYPITGDIFLPQHWPVAWDRFRVTWTIKDGKAEFVTVAVRTADLSSLPRIERNPRPGLAANILFGVQPHQDEVESILRTACGLLGFFADADIDFDRPRIEWEGETAEECQQLQLFSFSVGHSDREEPLPIGFDLVARCFLSAVQASDREVPLRFMAKGRRDLRAGRYIDAYYGYYFFLETQFAPGYSDPKKVKRRFKEASEIMAAIGKARKLATRERGRVRQMAKLIKLSDDELIEHLVDTRGRLHHHALPRKAGSWHPDKHNEFEAEALFVSYLANEVAQRQNMPILFSDTINAQLGAAARQEGVEYTYLVEASGGGDRQGLGGLPLLRISLPTLSPTHGALVALEEELRREGSLYDRKFIRGYTIKSTDGSKVFARYQNHTFLESQDPASVQGGG